MRFRSRRVKRRKRNESDQEYAMFDGKVRRSQRGIVVVVLCFRRRGRGNDFRYQNNCLLNINCNRCVELCFQHGSFNILSFVNECLIFAARRCLMTMTGRKALFSLANIGFCKDGNILNVSHTNMHTDHKAG